MRGARVLITGGTGTLGSALVRRLWQASQDGGGPARVRVLSRDEHRQAEMIEQYRAWPVFDAFIGDVRDTKRVLMACHGITVVVHAAALKRVDVVAYNPSEAMETNIIGTRNVLEAAMLAGVERVVVVSSDKAVAPATSYGASKYYAEALAVDWNTYGWPRGMRSAAVRYGNVLGSRGSVIERWMSERAAGVPLTVVNPDATRFWMTVDDAVDSVLWALAAMVCGEVFVPDMRSCLVGQLAAALAPGMPWQAGEGRDEKQHEVMVSAAEEVRTWSSDGGYRIYPARHPWRAVFPPVGTPVDSGFDYTSNAPARLMSDVDLRALLKRANLPGGGAHAHEGDR